MAGCAGSDGVELRAVGHRVVHGGPDFDRPVLIDAAILDRLAALQRWRRCTSRTTSRRSASACDRPGRAAGRLLRHRLPPRPPGAHRLLRPAPRALRRGGPPLRLPRPELRVHRPRLPEMAPEIAGGRVIVAHLGSGDSMCALPHGRSIESTMGFTALDGLPMGTRPGQLDPGVVLHLIDQRRHRRRPRSPTSSTRRRASRASPASPTTCATCWRATNPAPPSPSSDSSTAPPSTRQPRRRPRRPRRLRLHRRHRRALGPDPRRIAERLALARRRARPGRQRGRRSRASPPRKAASRCSSSRPTRS